MKMLKHMIVFFLTIAMVFTTTDAFASKYKSSSSRSSFSSRPVSRPAPAAPKPQPYVRPTPKPVKYTSSTSSATKPTSSASSLYGNKQAQQKSASSYTSMNTPAPKPVKPYDYKQAQPSKPVTSSYGSSSYGSSSSYNKTSPQYGKPTTSYTSPSHTTVVVKERGGLDIGDVIVGTMVANALTNTAAANTNTTATSAATNQQVAQLQQEVQQLKQAQTTTAPGSDKSSLPTLKFCAGQRNLNYYNYATMLHNRAKQYNVEIVTTDGSLDNLHRIHSGECDAGIVQRDSYEYYGNNLDIHRISSPYSDEAILMCTVDSGITKVNQITENTMVAILPAKSGASSTWSAVTNAFKLNPRYMNVNNNREQLLALDSNRAQCAFMVTTRSAPLFKIGQSLGLTAKVRAVHIPYSELKDIKDPSGGVIYYPSQLDKFQDFSYTGRGSILGFGYNTSAETVLVPNDVIVSNKATSLPFIDTLINDVDSLKF